MFNSSGIYVICCMYVGGYECYIVSNIVIYILEFFVIWYMILGLTILFIYDSSIHLFIDVFADTARRQLLVWKDFIKVGEVKRGAISA